MIKNGLENVVLKLGHINSVNLCQVKYTRK